MGGGLSTPVKNCLIYLNWPIYSSKKLAGKFGKFRETITVLVHVAETMKRMFVSLSRYWWKRYLNCGNYGNDKILISVILKLWWEDIQYIVSTSSNKNWKETFTNFIYSLMCEMCLNSNMCNIYIKVLRTRLLRKFDKFYHCVIYFL